VTQQCVWISAVGKYKVMIQCSECAIYAQKLMVVANLVYHTKSFTYFLIYLLTFYNNNNNNQICIAP